MAIRGNLRRRERGQSILEASLMAPWILILFAGILDFGFYGYAMVATQNATRVAALYGSQDANSSNDQKLACTHAKNELRMMANYGSFAALCDSGPLKVQVNQIPPASSADGELGTEVAVTYQTIQLFPIPGLTGRLNITRKVQMRVED